MATAYAGNTTDALYRREIQYDRSTRDYRATLDGKLVGCFPNYQEADDELNRIVFNELVTAADEAAEAELEALRRL